MGYRRRNSTVAAADRTSAPFPPATTGTFSVMPAPWQWYSSQASQKGDLLDRGELPFVPPAGVVRRTEGRPRSGVGSAGWRLYVLGEASNPRSNPVRRSPRRHVHAIGVW